ncbi:MAG: peptidoglycan-binding protein [Atopobiaceae bacterium]|nr:peptidoglycan-binding protein [Atopobiaceae bacterium]MBR1829123.1 peptidoglycan-binding protein [Atopobiaceae bacterium]
MDPIREGATGLAVEDIQERLGKLGYAIDANELESQLFGSSTASAVAKFRLDHGIVLGTEVDTTTWAELVDEGYEMGDRTLYLRLPNFHGGDVRFLQNCLNILGFSCGEPDGYYGVHTEAAVKQFQESQGILADGMAFPDTFDAIERLRHVWNGKPATGPHPMGGMGFARAASVLENVQLSITAEDPISRNIAGRIWNLASATTDKSGLELIEDTRHMRSNDRALFVLSTTPLPGRSTSVANVLIEDFATLPLRMHAAVESVHGSVPVVRLELPFGLDYDGSFTTGDAQTFAVIVLDAICTAFDE